jgi:hypothetical protein
MNFFRGQSIVFISIVFTGVIGYYLIHFGFYPIAIVNGSFVSEGRFSETENFIKNYYEKARVTYSLSAIKPGNPEYEAEVARATLDKLIDQKLMRARLKTLIGKELGTIIDQKLANAKATGADFAKAVETIYGLSLDRFTEAVLVPQAEEEILRGRMLATDEDFDAWLIEVRKNGRVIILHPNLTWNGEKVVLRK